MQHEQSPVALKDPEVTESPPRPEIWVGATSDYEGDRRFGGWIDAAQEQAKLQADIRAIIDRTPDAGRQHWHIHDVRGFANWQPAQRFGLQTVARIARGIVVHGPAYSALVQIVGADSAAARQERFRESFLGDWPSLVGFAEQVADDWGWQDHVARLPENLRPYVRFDSALLARVARRDLTTFDHGNGVWVYDPRRW